MEQHRYPGSQQAYRIAEISSLWRLDRVLREFADLGRRPRTTTYTNTSRFNIVRIGTTNHCTNAQQKRLIDSRRSREWLPIGRRLSDQGRCYRILSTVRSLRLSNNFSTQSKVFSVTSNRRCPVEQITTSQTRPQCLYTYHSRAAWRNQRWTDAVS